MAAVEKVDSKIEKIEIDLKSLISKAVQIATAKGAIFDRDPNAFHYVDSEIQIIYNKNFKLIDISLNKPLDVEENTVFMLWDFEEQKLSYQLPNKSQQKLYDHIMSLSPFLTFDEKNFL